MYCLKSTKSYKTYCKVRFGARKTVILSSDIITYSIFQFQSVRRGCMSMHCHLSARIIFNKTLWILTSQNVSGSQRKTILSPSGKISHLPFTTIVDLIATTYNCQGASASYQKLIKTYCHKPYKFTDFRTSRFFTSRPLKYTTLNPCIKMIYSIPCRKLSGKFCFLQAVLDICSMKGHKD